MPIINISMEIVCFFVTLILLFCTVIDKNKNTASNKIFTAMLTVNAFLLIEDILAWSFCGNQKIDAFLYINASIGYILGNIVSCLLAHYISASIGTNSKKLKIFTRVMDAICIFASILVIVSLFNGMYFTYNDGIYRRGYLYWLSQALPVLMLVTNELFVLENRKKLGKRYTLSMLSYAVLPALAMIVQYSYLDLEITYVASTLSLLIIHVTINAEQSRKLAEKEKELTEAKIDILLSQIQPHFLYNSLTAIKDLCGSNPPKAKVIVDAFAKYLRVNMDSLTRDKCVLFRKELEHVKTYLLIEKERFGDKLKIEYNIEDLDFMLPPLSVQPIVENAVKHGLQNSSNGKETVTISTYSDKTNYYVEIKDNGAGFDITKTLSDERSHIGINNVKNRLTAMCGGTIKIESKIGKGTTVIMKIPGNSDELGVR